MKRLVLVMLVGCGDNLASTCEVVEPAAFTEGVYSDPYAVELSDCVEGGLAEIAGRWFVRDTDQFFQFSYPLYEGTCDGGARIIDLEDQVLPSEDGFRSYQQWWDHTRVVTRYYSRFQVGEIDFEYATVEALCMRADGTLGGRWLRYDNDFGEETGPLLGTRFDAKDELSRGLELVAEVGTSSLGEPFAGFNVAVEGGIAYVAGPQGIEIVDVSSPQAPHAMSHVEGMWNDVRVVRGETSVVVFGATNSFETMYIDVTDPTGPYVAGAVRGATQFATSHSLQVSGNRLYLADYTDAVPVFDISDPLSPILLGSARVPDSDHGIHDLTVDGETLFINQTSAGFVALDLGDSLAKPTLLGRTTSAYSHASAAGTVAGRKLALHGDEGMTGSDGGAFLRVLDGDPASAGFLSELGRYQSRPEVGIHNFELIGDRAYIAYYQDGVRVVDLSDPTRPREVAHYNTWDPATASSGPFSGALGIRVVDGLIYVADSERGLLILREN